MAELNIRERQAGDVSVLDLNGEVRIGDSAAALRGAIRGLIAGGKQKILLNLAGVKYIDSSGIGELIANYTTVGRGGGQLKLLSLTEKVQDLLVITKLLTVFDVYEDESEALSSFK
jgi:anti-sigma B factor antagonist